MAESKIRDGGDQPLDDEVPELELDDAGDIAGDLSGRSYDELGDRARAELQRGRIADEAELEPDDAAAAALESEGRAGPDADERPV